MSGAAVRDQNGRVVRIVSLPVFRRRIVVLLSLSLACVALGGWFVAAPALPRAGAPVIEPPASLDATRARPDAGAAPAALRHANDATMPIASSAQPDAASGSGHDAGRCGEDQAPVYSDAVPEEDADTRGLPELTKPAGVGYTGAQRRVDAALRATGDPFDAGVADALNVGELRTPDDRLAAVVQDAVVGDDPRLYALAFSICNGIGTVLQPGVPGALPAVGETGQRSCARLDPRRWAARDPGNAVPWLYALERADAAGDRTGQREALQQLASTSRFQMSFGTAAAAVARVQSPSDDDLAGKTFLVMQAVPFQLWPPFTGLTLRCKDKAGGDAAMAATCEHVADVLFDHSDGLLPRAVGASIHKLATGDATRVDQALTERKALVGKWGQQLADDADSPACEHARRLLRHFVLVGKVGEVEAMKQEIAARIAAF